MELSEYLDISFIDNNCSVISEYAKSFGNIPNCKFICDNIFNHGPGILVSPANSYGDMGGGIDLQYKTAFPGIESRFQNYIQNIHAGKLDIGSAQIVPTNDPTFPLIVFTPTVERFGTMSTSKNIRLASKGLFQEVIKYNLKPNTKKIERLLIPGMGTGAAALLPEESARAVLRGYNEANESFSIFWDNLEKNS